MQKGWYDRRVRQVRDLSCGGYRILLELEVRRLDCRNCGGVKRERLDFLADNPHYTKRFAYYVGRRCRRGIDPRCRQGTSGSTGTRSRRWTSSTCGRSWRAPARRGREAIGIDEISIRKGHSYRIVVSDLIAGGRSGSAARTAPRRAWRSSTTGWAAQERQGSASP